MNNNDNVEVNQMSNYEYKTGHPILGVILGLLGIAIALALTLLTGAIGGGIALLLGVIGLLLGIKARKGGRGIPAIVVGALAILLAVIMTFSSVSMIKHIRDNPDNSEEIALLSQYADKPYMGVLGIALSIPKDEASLTELMEKVNAVK